MNRKAQDAPSRAARSDAGRQRGFILRRAGFTLAFLTLLTGLILSGCGDLTSGGYGDVEVTVVSDPLPSVASPETFFSQGPQQGPEFANLLADHLAASDREALPQRYNQLSDAGSSVEGSLRIRTRVYLRRGDRGWLEITRGISDLSLSLHQGEEEVLASNRIPEGRYDGVRVDFHFVQAQVDRGLQIQGDTLSGPIAVTLRAGGISLLFPDTVTISDNARTSIVLQLRGQDWIRKVNRIQRTVAEGDFEEEVRLEVRR